MVSSFLAGLAFVAGAFTGMSAVMFVIRKSADSDREIAKQNHQQLVELHSDRNEIFDDMLTAIRTMAKNSSVEK